MRIILASGLVPFDDFWLDTKSKRVTDVSHQHAVVPPGEERLGIQRRRISYYQVPIP